MGMDEKENVRLEERRRTPCPRVEEKGKASFSMDSQLEKDFFGGLSLKVNRKEDIDVLTFPPLE